MSFAPQPLPFLPQNTNKSFPVLYNVSSSLPFTIHSRHHKNFQNLSRQLLLYLFSTFLIQFHCHSILNRQKRCIFSERRRRYKIKKRIRNFSSSQENNNFACIYNSSSWTEGSLFFNFKFNSIQIFNKKVYRIHFRWKAEQTEC